MKGLFGSVIPRNDVLTRKDVRKMQNGPLQPILNNDYASLHRDVHIHVRDGEQFRKRIQQFQPSLHDRFDDGINGADRTAFDASNVQV